MNATREAGHTFLSRLGKTRLRPGGVEATQWLFQRAELSGSSQVLEVACNMGTTAIELAQRFGCRVYAVDMDKDALAKARQNIQLAGVDNQVCVMAANATRLPFPDATFDVVINEAMLTMYADKAKEKLVAEYFRVLKPGGRLLTHDLMCSQDSFAERDVVALQEMVKSHVSPMTRSSWLRLFNTVGFVSVSCHSGPMSLMSAQGLIKDEGFRTALKIIRNGLLKRENRPRFLAMLRFFRRQRRNLNFIACCATKATALRDVPGV